MEQYAHILKDQMNKNLFTKNLLLNLYIKCTKNIFVTFKVCPKQ